VKLRAAAPKAMTAIIVLTVSAAWAVLAPPVIHRLEDAVASTIQKRVDLFLGGLEVSLSYQSAQPRLFGVVSLLGVAMQGSDGLTVRADLVEIGYDALALLDGRFKPQRIRFEDVAIDASIKGAIETVRQFFNFAASLQVDTDIPSRPAVELRRAVIHLRLDDNAKLDASVKAADLVFMEDGSLGVSVAGDIKAVDTARRFMAGSAEMPFAVSSTVVPEKLSATLAVSLALDSDIGKVVETRLDAVVDSSGFSITSRPGRGLRSLDVAWNKKVDQFQVDGTFDAWTPRNLFQPRGKLAFLAPWFSPAYSGSISVTSDLSAEGTRASVTLSGVIPLDVPGGNPAVSLSASGTWSSLQVREATFRNDSFDLSFDGNLSPSALGADGTLGIEYFIGNGVNGTGMWLDTDLTVYGAGSSWFAYAPDVGVAGTELRDATISVELAEKLVSFFIDASLPSSDAYTRNTVEAGQPATVAAANFEPVSVAASPRLEIEGTVTLGLEPYVEAALRFGATNVGSLGGLLEALFDTSTASLLAPLGVEGEVSIYSDFKEFSFNSSQILFIYDGAISGFGVASFSGGLDRLELRSLDATIAGYTVAGSASIEYGNNAGAGFNADISVEGIPYALNGAIVDGSVTLSGDYGLRFTANGSPDGFGAHLSVVDMPIPFFDTVSFLSTTAVARFASLHDWDVVIEGFSLSQASGVDGAFPDIALSGAFDESGGRFGLLTLKDAVSGLKGTTDVTWNLQDGFRVSGNGYLGGPDGELYVFDGSYDSGGAMEAVLSIKKAPLARIDIPLLRGWVDVEASVHGTLKEPVVDFSFTMNGGQRIEGLPFAAGTGLFGGNSVTLWGTRMRLGEQVMTDLSFKYGFKDSALSLSAAIGLSFGKKVLSGTINANGATNVSLDAESISPLDDYGVKGNVTELRWGDEKISDLGFTVTMLQGVVDVTAGAKGQARGRIGSQGELSIELDTSLPVSFQAGGVLADSNLSLDVSNAVVDLAFLFRILDLPIIKVPSGIASGSLRIRGNALDPSVEGVAEFENFFMLVPDFVSGPIGPITEPLYFTGRAMESNQPGVPCGEASVMAAIESTLHGGIPDDIRISVKTQGSGLAPLKTRLFGMDIAGNAMAELLIEANRDRTRINGAITMASGDIILTPAVTKNRMSGSSSYDLSGALDLSFGKDVRIYFPDKRLPVIYGQADPSSRLEVAFDMSRGDYSLKGLTSLRGGSVFYIQRNFYLKTATIEFDENEGQFDPKINLEAETRSSSDSGTVVITLRAVDRRLFDLSFMLESVPAMSETDIQQMLGQNLVGTTSDGNVDIGRVIVENSDLIPQLNVTSVLERNLQTLLGLDLFVVRSLVFQRWLYDLSGLSGSANAVSLADYLDGTSVVAGKYFGDKLFAQLVLALAADPLASTTALSLDSEISLEWKAPHFTLNWNLQPKNLDSLFIEDQSFSFLWRIPLK